jgi:hypothetical protein
LDTQHKTNAPLRKTLDRTPNESVLLQVGYFITSRPELQLSFVLKVEDNILLLGFIRQAQTTVDTCT